MLADVGKRKLLTALGQAFKCSPQQMTSTCLHLHRLQLTGQTKALRRSFAAHGPAGKHGWLYSHQSSVKPRLNFLDGDAKGIPLRKSLFSQLPTSTHPCHGARRSFRDSGSSPPTAALHRGAGLRWPLPRDNREWARRGRPPGGTGPPSGGLGGAAPPHGGTAPPSGPATPPLTRGRCPEPPHRPRPPPARPPAGADVTSAARARPSSRAGSAVSRAQSFAVGWPGGGEGRGGTGPRSRSASSGSAVLARPPRAEAAHGMSVPGAAAAAASTRAPADGQRARLPARSLRRERSE